MCESPSADIESSALSYEEKLLNVSVIAKPIASKKTASKVYKLIKKASKKKKTCLRIGLKQVQGKIRKDEKGIVIMAGDVAPVDIICHMPAVCEEKDIPYIFTPSKMDIGGAVGTKGPIQIVLILKDPDYEEAYDKVLEAIKKTKLEEQ